mmetsp:Transcript_31104/g.88824  ORF Transcript_31104/g.88824 Transcript_31104/m.88824 type:complete len:400 (-) Transcript_31104:62-1261(-)
MLAAGVHRNADAQRGIVDSVPCDPPCARQTRRRCARLGHEVQERAQVTDVAIHCVQLSLLLEQQWPGSVRRVERQPAEVVAGVEPTSLVVAPHQPHGRVHTDGAHGLDEQWHSVSKVATLCVVEILLSESRLENLPEDVPHASLAKACADRRDGVEDVSEGEVFVLAVRRVQALLLRKLDDVGAVERVAAIPRKGADSGLVRMRAHVTVGDATGDPYSALLANAAADEVHHPRLLPVHQREGLAGAGVAMRLGHVVHDRNRLPCGLRPLQGDPYQGIVIDDCARLLAQLLHAVECRFADGEAVLVHHPDDIVGVGGLGNLAHVLAGAELPDLPLRPGWVVAGLEVLHVAVEGRAVAVVGELWRAICRRAFRGDEVGAGIAEGCGSDGPKGYKAAPASTH